MACFIVIEIFRAQRADRNQAVGAGIAELENSPARVTPETRPWKLAPMRSARKCAISRSAVSRSAFMARRSVTEICAATSLKLSIVSVSGSAPSPRPSAADQGAMHDQVGVSADRRSEMGVASQVQAEMAEILGGYSAWACERNTTSFTSGSDLSLPAPARG